MKSIKPKNIKHTTADGIVIYRMARKYRRKVHHSREWYLIRWKGRSAFYFPLDRNLKAAAKRAAQIDAYIRSGTQEELIQVKEVFRRGRIRPESKKGDSTIGELMDAITTESRLLNLDAATARSYANSLIKIVREALAWKKEAPISTEEVRKKSAAILTDATFIDFKRARIERAEALNDKLKEASAFRSANKDIRQAQAAVGVKAQEMFTRKHFQVPDLAPWRSVSQFGGVEEKYRLPPVEAVLAVGKKIKAIKAGSNLWLVCMLALHLGMRRREIAFARWSWFTPGATPRVEVRRESDFAPKRNHERSIEVVRWVFEALKAHETAGETYVLTGDKAERLRAVDKLAVGFLRKAGIKAGKPVHELRKWYGSWVAATRGLTVAQRQLGHDSYATTEKYYRDINFPTERLGSLWEE